MTDMNRRHLLAGLPAILAAVHTADGQVVTPPLDKPLDTPRVFPYDDLPVRQNPNGSESRSVLHGTLVTGEAIEIHESTIPPGAAPNPPHHHRQSDMMFIRQGTLAIEHDGKSEKVGPGGVIFVSSDTLHTVRNVGDTPATYFVVIVGRDATKQLI